MCPKVIPHSCVHPKNGAKFLRVLGHVLTLDNARDEASYIFDLHLCWNYGRTIRYHQVFLQLKYDFQAAKKGRRAPHCSYYRPLLS